MGLTYSVTLEKGSHGMFSLLRTVCSYHHGRTERRDEGGTFSELLFLIQHSSFLPPPCLAVHRCLVVSNPLTPLVSVCGQIVPGYLCLRLAEKESRGYACLSILLMVVRGTLKIDRELSFVVDQELQIEWPNTLE